MSMKKWLSIFLSAAMVLNALPLQVLANETVQIQESVEESVDLSENQEEMLVGEVTPKEVETSTSELIEFSSGEAVVSDVGNEESITIFFDNSVAQWNTVYAFAFNLDGTEYLGSWPGTKTVEIGDNKWAVEVPISAQYIIFNNGSSQTHDLQIPTNGNNCYEYHNDAWVHYHTSDCSDCVAAVSGTTYLTMDAALEAWQTNGGTLKLLKDADYEYSGDGAEYLTCSSGDAVIDLNGFTMDLKNAVLSADYNTLSVKNGTISSDWEFTIYGNGTLNLDNLTIINTNQEYGWGIHSGQENQTYLNNCSFVSNAADVYLYNSTLILESALKDGQSISVEVDEPDAVITAADGVTLEESWINTIEERSNYVMVLNEERDCFEAYASVYSVTLDAYEFHCDGTEKKPTIVVRASDNSTLSEDQYTVTYQRPDSYGEWANTDDLCTPGFIRVVVDGKKPHSGQVSAEYYIHKLSPTADLFTVTLPEGGVYDGKTRTAVVEASGTPDLEFYIEYIRDDIQYFYEPVKDAGSYEIVLHVNGNEIYDEAVLTNPDWNFVIERAPLTIAAKDQTITYGDRIDSDKGMVTVTGTLPEGHSIESLQIASDDEDAVTDNGVIRVGDALIFENENLVSDNFDITYIPGKLIVQAEEIGRVYIDLHNFRYNGQEQYPYLEVFSASRKLLSEGTDYDLEYFRQNQEGEWLPTTDLTNSGKMKVVVTATGNYTGTWEDIFTIEKTKQRIGEINLAAVYGDTLADFSDELAECLPDHEQTLVWMNSESMSVGSVTFDENGNDTPHTFYAKLEETKNYEAVENIPIFITVLPKELDDSLVTITVADDELVYDGTEKIPAVTATYGNKTLREGVDFELTYIGNTDASSEGNTPTVLISFLGNYSGRIEKSFNIKKADLDLWGVDADLKVPDDLVYNGDAQSLVTWTYYHGTEPIHFEVNDVLSEPVDNPLGTDAGEYKVVYWVEESANYNAVPRTELTVTIAKAQQSSENNPNGFTFEWQAEEYGTVYNSRPVDESEEFPEVQFYGIDSDALPDYEIYYREVGASDYIEGFPIAAGTYEVKAVMEESANMGAASDSMIVRIGKAELTAYLSGSVSKIYNDSAAVPEEHELTLLLEGVFENDDVTVSAESYTYSDANAGTEKTITANGLALSGSDAENYELCFGSVADSVGIITPATLDLSGMAWVGSAICTYTGVQQGPTLTGSLPDVLEAVLSGDRAVDIGNYCATAEFVFAEGIYPGNYIVTYPNDSNVLTFSWSIKAEIAPPESGDGSEESPALKLEANAGISETPDALKDNEDLDTPEEIEEVMLNAVVEQNSSVPTENRMIYDVTLMVSEDGINWVAADEEHWPASGKLTVTLPYPQGTDSRYVFTVAHMFTKAMNGNQPGDIEYPVVTNTVEGIQFQVSGLSPIALGWTEPAVSAPIVPDDEYYDSEEKYEDEDEYRVSVKNSSEGSITSNLNKASEGEKVTLKIKANKGYSLYELSVIDRNGKEVKLTKISDGKYSFRMPAGKVTIRATFDKVSAGKTNPNTGAF